MITAVHSLVYSDDAAATRAFLRDVLRWPHASDDDSSDAESWLIFGSGPSEVGVHPTSAGADGSWSAPRHHELSLMCDDLESTMSEIASRGGTFMGEPFEERFGHAVMLEVPGADPIMLYQPHHKVAYLL